MKQLINFLGVILVIFAASCQHIDDLLEHGGDPKEEHDEAFKTDAIEPVHMFLVDKDGNEPTDPSAPVYESRKMNPVLTPNGHHVTLGEFDGVKGKLKLMCTEEGTQVKLKLEGLIPFGLYSVWVLVFEEPGFTPDFAHEIAEGVPGGNAGKYSSFVAGSDGTATYSEIVPKGNMSFFGNVGDCLLDEYEVHVVGAYHMDGQTYGGELGPDGKAVEQFAFVYQQ